MSRVTQFMLAVAALWIAAAGAPSGAQQQERPDAARRPANAAGVDRGRDAFRANCGFCHGIDARGAQGPDLARSLAVLNDDQGKDLGNFLKAGVPERGMPAFPMLTADEARDISSFLHTVVEQARRQKPMDPTAVVVGDAKAGEAYFNGAGRCNMCHSRTGDFKGVGARYDPATLQDRMVNPRGRGGKTPPPPTMVKVTLPNGRTLQGRLVAITDFYVTLIDDSNTRRTFPRDNEVPKVEINDPLQAHLDMLLKYTDADMHNLTAYLVTLK